MFIFCEGNGAQRSPFLWALKALWFTWVFHVRMVKMKWTELRFVCVILAATAMLWHHLNGMSAFTTVSHSSSFRWDFRSPECSPFQSIRVLLINSNVVWPCGLVKLPRIKGYLVPSKQTSNHWLILFINQSSEKSLVSHEISLDERSANCTIWSIAYRNLCRSSANAW